MNVVCKFLIEGFILLLAYGLAQMFLKGALLYGVGVVLGLVFLFSVLRAVRFISI
jgi:hypothetical protein